MAAGLGTSLRGATLPAQDTEVKRPFRALWSATILLRKSCPPTLAYCAKRMARRGKGLQKPLMPCAGRNVSLALRKSRSPGTCKEPLNVMQGTIASLAAPRLPSKLLYPPTLLTLKRRKIACASECDRKSSPDSLSLTGERCETIVVGYGSASLRGAHWTRT